MKIKYFLWLFSRRVTHAPNAIPLFLSGIRGHKHVLYTEKHKIAIPVQNLIITMAIIVSTASKQFCAVTSPVPVIVSKFITYHNAATYKAK